MHNVRCGSQQLPSLQRGVYENPQPDNTECRLEVGSVVVQQLVVQELAFRATPLKTSKLSNTPRRASAMANSGDFLFVGYACDTDHADARVKSRLNISPNHRTWRGR